MRKRNTALKVILASLALAFTADAFADEGDGKLVRKTHELDNGNTVEVVRRGRIDEEGNKRVRSAYRVTDADGDRIAAGISRLRADADGDRARRTHRVRHNSDGTTTRRHMNVRKNGDTVTRRTRTTRR